MFEHDASSVDRFAALAPSPIGVDLSILHAVKALLDMEVLPFVISVDRATAPITPKDRQVADRFFFASGMRHGFPAPVALRRPHDATAAPAGPPAPSRARWPGEGGSEEASSAATR